MAVDRDSPRVARRSSADAGALRQARAASRHRRRGRAPIASSTIARYVKTNGAISVASKPAAPVVFEKSAFEIGAEPDRCGRPPWRSRPHAFDVRTKETRVLSRRCRPACALAQLLEARATPSDIVKPAITRTSQRDLPAVLTRAKPSVRATGPEAGGIDPRPAWFRPGRELEKPAFCVASGKARNVAHPQNHGLGFAYSKPNAAGRARASSFGAPGASTAAITARCFRPRRAPVVFFPASRGIFRPRSSRQHKTVGRGR